MAAVIYGLFCPLSGELRYIGKAKNPQARFRTHLSHAKGGRPHHVCAWIRSILDAGSVPIMKTLRQLAHHECWQSAEKELIAQYTKAGARLTNLTGGGEGFHEVAPSVIAKRVAGRREWWLNRADHARLKAIYREAASRPETVAKRKRAGLEIWQDDRKRSAMLSGMAAPDAKARRAAATKRRMSDPITRQQHAAKMKALAACPERRAQIAAASVKRWAIYRERIAAEPKAEKPKRAKGEASRVSALARWADPIKAEAARNALRSPEARARSRKAAIARATPEYRAIMAEKTRLSWEKRRAKRGAAK